MDEVKGIMKPNSSVIKRQKTWQEACWFAGRPLQADGVSYQAYYSEVGKASHKGKDLTEVHSPQRKLVPDKVGLGQYEQTSLRGIAIKAFITLMLYAKASTTEEPDALCDGRTYVA